MGRAGTSAPEGGEALVTAPNLRHEFWQQFKSYMAGASGIGCSRPSYDGWMWHAADLSSGYLASLVNVRLGQIGVRFRLNGLNADTVFSFLESQRTAVDASLLGAPAWRSGEGSSHVIEVLTGADISVREEWPAQMAWLRTELESFQAALWPFVGRVPPGAGRRQWDEQLFFGDLTAWNPGCVAPARLILEEARRRGEAVQWGSGAQAGSFSPSIPLKGVAHQLVSARTDGTFQLLFTRLRESAPFAARERRLELLARVNQVGHLHLPEATIDQRPSVPLAVLSGSGVCEQFVELMSRFHDTVLRDG